MRTSPDMYVESHLDLADALITRATLIGRKRARAERVQAERCIRLALKLYSLDMYPTAYARAQKALERVTDVELHR